MANSFSGRQDASAKLDWGIDWSEWMDDGDSISVSDWTASSDDLTLSSDSVSGDTTIVWVEGGSAGNWYTLTNSIVTSEGREDERTIRLQIVNT